jgi:hypothetical protein
MAGGDEMATSDASIFAWAIGKAVVILVSSFCTVVYCAWLGVKRGLLK